MKPTETPKVDPIRKAKAYDALYLLANAPVWVPGFATAGFITDIAKDMGYIKPDGDGGHDG